MFQLSIYAIGNCESNVQKHTTIIRYGIYLHITYFDKIALYYSDDNDACQHERIVDYLSNLSFPILMNDSWKYICHIFSDIDECFERSFSCSGAEECQNLAGSYRCLCPASLNMIKVNGTCVCMYANL